MMTKDFSYLLRPELYHQLSQLSVPAAFRSSSSGHQPTPDSTLEDLLGGGHFRAAAIAAVQALTSSSAGMAPVSPSDHARIFELLYARLSCLCLVDATPLAAQEAKALEDLNSAFYLDPESGTHLVPWELRVLAVRLQTIGFGDPRRAVMSYYELAREARAAVTKAVHDRDREAARLWEARLSDLGVRVAGALVEMDDLASAAEHLATLGAVGGVDGDTDGRLAISRALMWLHLGDVEAARRCIGGSAEDVRGRVIDALADMADGEYETALEKWKALRTEMAESNSGGDAKGHGAHGEEMVGVNLAVCLLYVGRMEEVRISISVYDFIFHTLSFSFVCTRQSFLPPLIRTSPILKEAREYRVDQR